MQDISTVFAVGLKKQFTYVLRARAIDSKRKAHHAISALQSSRSSQSTPGRQFILFMVTSSSATSFHLRVGGSSCLRIADHQWRVGLNASVADLRPWRMTQCVEAGRGSQGMKYPTKGPLGTVASTVSRTDERTRRRDRMVGCRSKLLVL